MNYNKITLNVKSHFTSPLTEAKGQIHSITWGLLEIKGLKLAPPRFSTLYVQGRKNKDKQHLLRLEKIVKKQNNSQRICRRK